MPVLHPPRQRIKPAKWALDPGKVAPEGQWAWDDRQAMSIPLWMGAGAPRAIQRGRWLEASAVGSPGWAVGREGQHFPMDGTEREWLFPSNTLIEDLTTGDHAFTAVFRANQSSQSDFIMSSGDGTQWWGMAFGGSGRADKLSPQWDDDVSKVQIDGDIVVADGELHVVTMQRRGDTYELWVDGVADGTAAVSGGFSVEEDITLGAPTWADGFWPTGVELYAVYLRSTYMLEAQMRTLARAPFAPFRRQRAVWVNVPATGGTTVSGFGTATATATSQNTARVSHLASASGEASAAGASTAAVRRAGFGSARGEVTAQNTARVSHRASASALSEATGVAQAVVRHAAFAAALGAADAQNTAAVGHAGFASGAAVATGSGVGTLAGTVRAFANALASADGQGVAGVTHPATGSGLGEATAENTAGVRRAGFGDATGEATAQSTARLLIGGYASALAEAETSAEASVAHAVFGAALASAEGSALATVVGTALDLSGPFLLYGEGPARTMDGEGPRRTMRGEGPERDMSGEA